ncbi:MAG: polynucleotide adenylyltransferase PcnB, partial [Bradymonadia bacterium]
MYSKAKNVSVPVEIDEHRIDADAAFVIRRLRRSGFEAYLVGGSVRDLLLQRQPKDFDVATSASPEEIKQIFRRCRLIGRRFRLAHIMGQKGRIVETATFRSKPRDHSQDEIIWDDNEFGTVESDAHRRDFTINGLFYCTENNHVLDFVGGLEDLELKLVRTIGEPITRFREDPVRMLRAIKFAARLDFEIETESLAAIKQESGLLARAAVPRLLEELIRMLRGGAAGQSVSLMNECGILELLVPETFALLTENSVESDSLFKLLHGLDRFLKKTRR